MEGFTKGARHAATLFVSIAAMSGIVAAQRTSTGGATVRTEIRGTVRDARTHLPLARVVVMIESTTAGYAGQAETDASGKFDLQGLDQGQFDVRVKFPGYYETSQTVDLNTNPLAYVSFELRPRPGEGSPPPVAPEGPEAALNARLAGIPDKARKEFQKARESWQQNKDPQETIDHLNKATKAYPQFADAYVLLGSAYIQQNHPADAKAALQKAIEIDPKLADAQFTLGTLQNREKDFAGAEASLNAGLKLDDRSPQGHYELAKTYAALGKLPEAEQEARKAVTLLPTMAAPHVMLANIALHNHDLDTARTEFMEYLRLEPDGPMAPQVKQMVSRIDQQANQAPLQPK